LVAPGQALKEDGKPYTIFTPFKKWWLARLKAVPERLCPRRDQLAHGFAHEPGLDRFTLKALGFAATIAVPEASEAEARSLLSNFVANPIYDYENGRNRLAADQRRDPIPGTSFLSAHLHFGLLSIREAYWAADLAREHAANILARKSVETWIGELAWREFYQHILFHFPRVTTGNFRRVYDSLEWRQSPDELQAWKDGRTGYPVVDAAMRQLRQTGWMPNRARMIAASFLTKDLLIDWREGERHFMRWLIDGNLAANNGGWQWSAGTGTDAQPYFRIFNPVSQSRRFDRDGTYIRRWIPELRTVASGYIHAPWEMAQPPADYPPPIVDHGLARQRALEAFRKVRQSKKTSYEECAE
jgi:deoxyribodipyrimidine photo-lyase